METGAVFVAGIHLTERSILTIVQRTTMPRRFQPGEPCRVLKKGFWICLLLPILFLHNPFLAAPDSPGTLALQHPPSYRATIASSELLKFKNPEGLESILLKSIGLVHRDFLSSIILAPAPPDTRLGHAGDNEDLLPREQVLSRSLWFRPPPAA
jgi:hypothetical protein